LEDENIVKRIDENVWKEKNLNYHGWWMIKTAIKQIYLTEKN
jgi:hypothetical protein